MLAVKQSRLAKRQTMSTLAQEEADRFFPQKEHQSSHPEDVLDHDGTSPNSSNSFNQKNPADHCVNSEKDNDDDEDTLHSMTTTTTTATYRVPTTRFNANTGPKGVISDAQSFNRAKKSTFRSTLAAFTNGTFSHSSQPRKRPDPNKETNLSDNSDSELGASDEEDFMRQWRENRLKELASRGSAAQRRLSPSKRVWGTLDDVDATGYLDAVERVPDDAVVVVCIYDPLVCEMSTVNCHILFVGNALCQTARMSRVASCILSGLFPFADPLPNTREQCKCLLPSTVQHQRRRRGQPRHHRPEIHHHPLHQARPRYCRDGTRRYPRHPSLQSWRGLCHAIWLSTRWPRNHATTVSSVTIGPWIMPGTDTLSGTACSANAKPQLPFL